MSRLALERLKPVPAPAKRCPWQDQIQSGRAAPAERFPSPAPTIFLSRNFAAVFSAHFSQ